MQHSNIGCSVVSDDQPTQKNSQLINKMKQLGLLAKKLLYPI